MEAYELAAQLKKERAKEINVPTFKEIADLLNKAKLVWGALKTNKFGINEHGHLRFESLDYSTEKKDGWLDDIEVIFVDASGNRQKIGYIHRVEGDRKEEDVGFACIEAGGITRPITPEDEEWEAIVDSIVNAVNECSK